MRIEHKALSQTTLQAMSGVSNQEAQISSEIPIIGGQHQVSEKDLKGLVDKANQIVGKSDTRVQFSIHDKTRQIMVKLVDSATNEVIKEIPPEKMVDLVYNLCQQMGIFVDKKLE
ncbi:flagellar protein FlaG [Paenibacillus solani]|uniref:flagellar protein FlaG n=1 Tax=Paenibacillus solani TaxID=1705565 RepID=UPI003D296429